MKHPVCTKYDKDSVELAIKDFTKLAKVPEAEVRKEMYKLLTGRVPPMAGKRS